MWGGTVIISARKYVLQTRIVEDKIEEEMINNTTPVTFAAPSQTRMGIFRIPVTMIRQHWEIIINSHKQISKQKNSRLRIVLH